MSKKSSKKTKGSVGFLYNGTIKIGSAFMYYSDSVDPGTEIQKYYKYYGSNVQSRYIKCENPKEVYESILKKINEDDNLLSESLVSCHTASLVTIIKEVAKVNQAHKYKKKEVEDEEDEEDEDDEEEDDDLPPPPPVKNSKGKKKTEEKKVEKKVEKKSKGPAKKSKDESDEELSEEDESSDEEDEEVEEVKEVKVQKKKNTKETKVKGKK